MVCPTPPFPPSSAQALLAEALTLARELATPATDSNQLATVKARQQRFRQLRQDLTAFSHPLTDAPRPWETLPAAIRQQFVQACLLLRFYPALGGDDWQGTMAATTLKQFQPESIPTALQHPKFQPDLWQWFGLAPEALEQFQADLATLEHQLAQHQRVIRAVRDEIQARGCLGVFQALFGPLEIPEVCLTWGSTAWQIYFGLSYDGDCLCTWDEAERPNFQAWNQLETSARDAIQEFLAGLGEFNYGKFDRFPIFGACAGEEIDPAWVAAIAEKTGVAGSQVRRVLMRSVSILPTHRAESFLIHDIWGHHWQLWLTSFLNDYEFLGDCERELWPGETAYTPHGPLACRDLFEVQDQRVTLATEKARLFFHGEVQQRLGFLFTHLLGEMLADVAEFKFVCHFPEEISCLQSSSLFADHPAKLDLSLLDVDFLFLKVLKPLLEVRLSITEPTPLEAGLWSEWQANSSTRLSDHHKHFLTAAVAELYRLFFEEFQAYAPDFETSQGHFAAMIFNFLHIQNAVNQLYHHALTQAGIPLRDLLLIFIGQYCSQDCYQEFWTIDTVLATDFLPCCYHLQAWLERHSQVNPPDHG